MIGSTKHGPSDPVSGRSAGAVRPGDVLAGKYRIERILGEGGMGVVVAAHHLQLDQKVAIKFLLPAALADAGAVARFAREARMAVKIQGEHVARVTDVGELENGAPYMVMEYLEGDDLASWLARKGPLQIAQVIDFVLQACVAVAEAHAQRIVHRDLKPANLFCVRRSDGQLTIKVLDFGISKLSEPGAAHSGAALTMTSTVLGTPIYMSPEQMRSTKAVDARTDIWALGVILFELIAGVPPFQADTMPELVLNIAQDPPPSLRSLRPDAPAGLEEIIVRCIAKDPEQRYGSVGHLAVALLPFAPHHARPLVDRIAGIIRSANLPSSARASVPDSARGGTVRTAPRETMSSVERPTARGARSGAMTTAIAAALAIGVAVSGLGAWFLVRGALARPVSTATIGSKALPAAVLPGPSVSVAAGAASITPQPPPAPQPTPPPASATTPVVAAPAPRAATTVLVAAQPASRRPPSCDPPYTINAVGHRVHKPECP